jgi:hypothetical protein
VRIAVHAPRDPNPLFTLPRLDAVEALCDGPPWVWRFEDNVFLIPGAGLVVVLPREPDRLVLHRVDLDAALAKTDAPYLFVNSRPPAAVPGRRFEYAVDARSKAGGVKFKLDGGPDGMELTAEGLLTWDVPAGLAETVSVSVVVTDAAGRSVTHAFELVPAAVLK